MEHFNGLTPDELERLALLSEELGEAQQIIGKIIRHGYESSNPLRPDSSSNRQLLAEELGHVKFAISLIDKLDVFPKAIDLSCANKGRSVNRWLHHNKVNSAA